MFKTAPRPANEAVRLAWLRESSILDSPPETDFDEITQLAAQICGVPIAAISLIDEERQWFKSIVGLDARETDRDVAFCAHTILQSDVLIVEDATADERFAANPLVVDDPQIRFYAGAPLVCSDGLALGALCVVDHTPRKLTAHQEGVLKVLAAQVAGRIELLRRIALQEQLIAERNLTQQALLQREEELNAIVEHAMDAIYLADLSTLRVIKANAAFREMLGYSEAELTSLTLYDFVGHPSSSIDHNVKKIGQSKEVMLGERQYLRKDGSVLIVDVSARLITCDRRPAICVVAHDLTHERVADMARRSAEASFKSLFENAPEGIFQTTPQGQYLRVNPALARIYGYDTPEQMIAELVDISDQLYVEPGRRDEFQRLMALNSSIVGFESPVKKRDGSMIWISESARPVFNTYGDLVYYEGFVSDITERKTLEMQRERSLHQAQLRADRDFLTELWNHRAFHNQMEERLGQVRTVNESSALILLDIDNFKFFNDLYGHVVGDEVIRMVASHLQTLCSSGDILARFGGDEFAILTSVPARTNRDQVERKLAAGLRDLTFHPAGHGMKIPITVSLGAAISPTDGANRLDLLDAADERLRWAKTGGQAMHRADEIRDQLRDTIEGFSMLDALVTAVDNKDRYTRRHSEDVMNHCLVIASQLGLDKAAQHNLAVAALLHDVGKIGIQDSILRKPGNLTDAEYEAVKLHAPMGAAIVAAVPGLEATLDAVRYHHESYDGRGYPNGLQGDEIPLIARIMAVADAYSAMTTDRPYRKGMDRKRALSILAEGAGKHWDQSLVAAFLAAHGQPTALKQRTALKAA